MNRGRGRIARCGDVAKPKACGAATAREVATVREVAVAREAAMAREVAMVCEVVVSWSHKLHTGSL